MPSQRLFLALRPPAESVVALAEAVRSAIGGSLPGVRLLEAADLHLTLVFLGDVEPSRAGALEGALVEALSGLWAPRLAIRGAGGFPSLDAPRVLFAGVEEEPIGAGHLARLRERAREAARGVGWRERRADRRRPFHPHVTVARVSRAPAGVSARVPDAFRALELELAFQPDAAILFESHLGRALARHVPRLCIPLEGG